MAAPDSAVKPALDAKEVLRKGLVDYSAKSVIVADLDRTLTKSKTPIDSEMAMLLEELLAYKYLAMITGGMYSQFKRQFIDMLPKRPDRFRNLYVFTTCATTFYRFIDGDWMQVYAENLAEGEKEKIARAFDSMLNEVGYDRHKKTYGKVIEDRGTQMTFSALGQDAPFELKSAWDPEMKIRLAMAKVLHKHIPEFQITVGGNTSIDVTRKGIDKAYGIRKIEETLHCTAKDMLFLGDALMPGGNDYPVRTEGVDCVQVSGPDEGKEVIRAVIKSARGGSYSVQPFP